MNILSDFKLYSTGKDIMSDFLALLLECAVKGEHERMHFLARLLAHGCTLAAMSLVAKVVAKRKQATFPLQSFDEYGYEYLTGLLMVTQFKTVTLVWRNFGIHLYCDTPAPVEYANDKQLWMTREQAQARAGVHQWLCDKQLPCASTHMKLICSLSPRVDTREIAHHPITRLGIASIAALIQLAIVEQPYAMAKWVNNTVSFTWMPSLERAEEAAACSNAIVAAAVTYETPFEPRIERYYYGRP